MADKKLTVQEQQGVVEMVTRSFTRSIDYQRLIFTRLNDYYRMYRSITDNQKQNYQGRANLFVPYAYSTVETIMPKLVGGRPKIESVPRESTDMNSANANTKYTDYQWDMMNMKKKIKEWTRQSLIYGVGVIKLIWDTKENQPKAIPVDLFDYYPDPNGTSIDDMEYIIHRVERPIDILKKNSNYNITRELEEEVVKDEYKVQREAILGLTKPSDRNIKSVEVFEYWGLFDHKDGKGPVESLITIANRKYLLRVEPSPFKHGKKPFIDLHDTQVPGQYWSIGEIEPIQTLQYELNDVRNQRMDNVTMILNRMWKIDKTADVDEDELVWQPNGIIHTMKMNGIEPLEVPDVTSSSYNEETLIKGDIEQTSGVTDASRDPSGSSSKGETATGALIQQEVGNNRFKYKLDNLEDSLREFGKQLNGLNAQFIEEDQAIRVLGAGGPVWETIKSSDIKKEYDVIVEAGSTQPMNRAVRRAEARELIATVAPFVESGQINLDYFLKYLLQQYDLTDIEEALTKQGMQMLQQTGAPTPNEIGGGAQGSVFGGTNQRSGNNAIKGLATRGGAIAPEA